MNNLSLKLLAISVIAGVVLAFTNTSSAAVKTHSRSGSYQNSKGGSGTFNQTTVRSPGQVTREGTWTNQNNGVGQHEGLRTWDKTTGTGTVSASTTRPDGKTTSRTGTIAKTGDNTFHNEGILTGANGKQATYDTTTTKTDSGRSTTGTVTGPQGNQRTLNSEVSKLGNGETSRDTTLTGANGKTFEREVDTKINPDGTGTRTVEVTKADGSTETRTETFTVAKS